MKKTRKEDYREAWLHKALGLLRKEFAKVGVRLPEKIQISCSWPSTTPRKRIGECWTQAASVDAVFQIFISPLLGRKQTLCVLETLTHELCHTIDVTHKALFQKTCKAIGLVPAPKWTATGADKALAKRLNALGTQLGPYPHGQMTLKDKKKQTTRLLKLECEKCGCVVRVTRQWLDEYAGVPWPCPCKGTMMEEVKP